MHAIRKTLPAILLLLLAAGAARAQPGPEAVLREKTLARLVEIAASTRGVLGVAVVDLAGGDRFGVNEQLLFPQGSAIKVPILMEAYRQARAGRFRLSDPVPVRAADRVGGSGVLQHFAEGHSTLSVRDLGVLMIHLSDNTATNRLIELVGMARVNRTLDSLGLKATRLRRRMMDPAASARGDENLSTPAEAARILELLHHGRFVDEATSGEILSILRLHKPGDLRAGVPDAVPVASKAGTIPGVTTEWALVELPGRPYVVVAMESYGLDGEAGSAFRRISEAVYDYFHRLARASRYGTYVR